MLELIERMKRLTECPRREEAEADLRDRLHEKNLQYLFLVPPGDPDDLR